ncbi:MAG: pilus assembly protein [Alphaproteobacteria bacterium]|nr:MAG: pilus assembly protein [Alphaproteobacteria bacterium]
MSRRSFLRALRRDAGGATIVEFALILPVMCGLLVGVVDLGYRSYVSSIVQGALHEAARMGTVGGISTDTIAAQVRTRLRDFSRDATVTVTTRSYADFTGVRTPETITQDTVPLGQYNAGDCYQDFNGNGQFDLDRGRTGMGNAEDVVYFEVRMVYPRIVPVGNLFGWSDNVTINQNTVLRNQPFAARNTGVSIRCN